MEQTMKTEFCRAQAAVRRDHRTLVRAEAKIEIPEGNETVAAFYGELIRAAMRWAEEVLGERAGREYEALGDDVWAKSRFQPYLLRLEGTLHPVGERHFVIVTDRIFSHGTERRTGRTAQVWDRDENTVLPMREILRRWLGKRSVPRLGFRPDGCYPTGRGSVLFFRDPRGDREGRTAEKYFGELTKK